MLHFLLLFPLFLGLSISSQASNFGCLNLDGKVVDWWVIYKESRGFRYVYLDSTMDEPLGLNHHRLLKFKNSPLSMTVKSANFLKTQPSSAFSTPKSKSLFNPILPITSADFGSEPFYVAWNDQMAKGSQSAPEAHAKVRNKI